MWHTTHSVSRQPADQRGSNPLGMGTHTAQNEGQNELWGNGREMTQHRRCERIGKNTRGRCYGVWREKIISINRIVIQLGRSWRDTQCGTGYLCSAVTASVCKAINLFNSKWRKNNKASNCIAISFQHWHMRTVECYHTMSLCLTYCRQLHRISTLIVSSAYHNREKRGSEWSNTKANERALAWQTHEYTRGKARDAKDRKEKRIQRKGSANVWNVR